MKAQVISNQSTFIWNEKMWFRGYQQRKRAIQERKRLYNDNGIVIAKNESYTRKQASTVFANAKEVYEYINTIKYYSDKCFYEIVEDYSKLYFDIDLEFNNISLKQVLEEIYDFLKLMYNIRPTETVFLAAHRGCKKSWHIIFPEYYVDYTERQELSKKLYNSGTSYIDWRVYNATQPFRLCGCYKPDDFTSKFYLVNKSDEKIHEISLDQFTTTMVTQIPVYARKLSSKESQNLIN